MGTILQKTSFGPGVYRGHRFDVARLKSFAEGTNKAIAAGIPIPLLRKHAPINANDTETTQFASQDDQGAGWVKEVFVDDQGNLGFKADAVSPADQADIEAGRLRFTSPEFRPFYSSEKKGVYEGPVIRHFAFTPKPGNPHQSPIEAIAMSEQAWQFSEEDREPLTTQHDELGEDIRKDGTFSGSFSKPEHDDPAPMKNGEGASVDEETLLDDEEWFTDSEGKKRKRKKTAQETKDDAGESQVSKTMDNPAQMMSVSGEGGLSATSQHAEMNHHELLTHHGWKKGIGGGYTHENHPDSVILADSKDWLHSPASPNKKPKKGVGNDSLASYLTSLHSSQHAEGDNTTDDKEKGKKKIPEAVDDPAETSSPTDIVDPESPPPADNTGSATAENPDMPPPKATDKTKLAAILAGLNQKGIVLPSDFDFQTTEGANDILLAALNSSIKAENDREAEEAKDSEEDPEVTESAMPFSEEELTALPEKARRVIEAGQKALAEERAAKEKAQQEVIQFAEKERETKNNAARDKAKGEIEKTKIPPALKTKLLAGYDVLQFNEGAEPVMYTASQVAKMVAEALPPSLQFLEKEVNEADEPKVMQFFEGGDVPVGHVSPERARELTASNPWLSRNPVGKMPTRSEQVAADNAKTPNNVMRT